ncbi:uncharacterized protein METZ01_LOCUS366286, partial [marine metagenome]
MKSLMTRRLAEAATSDDELISSRPVQRFVLSSVYVAAPVVVLLVGWELVARLGDLPAALFPPLGDIFSALLRMAREGTLATDVFETFKR